MCVFVNNGRERGEKEGKRLINAEQSDNLRKAIYSQFIIRLTDDLPD